MREFELEEITYRNLMAVGQQPVNIKLNGFKKTLVTGINGAGKSSILEAVTFGLFGKPFRNITKTQLINSTNKKDLHVRLVMKFNGSRFIIERGQKPNIFTVEKDGVKLDEAASVKDFQTYFEEMIRMNYQSFKQVVVLGTAGYVPFMALNAASRRTLVEDLLEIGVLAEMDKINKTNIRELTQQLSVIDIKKDSLESQIRVYKESEDKQKQLSEGNIARMQEMYSSLVSDVRKLKEELLEQTDLLTNHVLSDDPSSALIDVVSKMATVKATVDSYTKVTKLYSTGGDCPTCLQGLVNDSLVTKINHKLQDYNVASEKLKEKHAELSRLKSEHQELLSVQRGYANNINSLKSRITSIANQAKQVKQNIDSTTAEVVLYTNEIADLTNQVESIIQEKSSMVMEKYHRGILTEMLKDTGIKASIVDRYIPLFNKRIKYYLNEVMQAEYTFTLDNKFNETISSRGREAFSYDSFSQGEKARIDISLLFTWRDIAEMVSGVKINCLFLDEVFDGSFDAQGIKHVQQIINKMDACVYVISHKDHNPDDYNRHLKLRKVGRFTVLD
ncbi:SbcC-like subunit of palindrome specific endonuclease [Pseudomonas phage PspYZU05]|uniref:Endonuclease subunit n=1 Tax=Pseudomonas phage PspYZU05 TaxID=1983556 RepID=A0A2U7NF26_9CAUD|nr:SbcC-like subunit of palindrome specific endonuclease [Pseudomonas phage PspYZU05]ASD52041.1 endonuclease subunit [Pseudomonas phage PspYZU05]